MKIISFLFTIPLHSDDALFTIMMHSDDALFTITLHSDDALSQFILPSSCTPKAASTSPTSHLNDRHETAYLSPKTFLSTNYVFKMVTFITA